jgi:hypothetical protein
MSKCPTCNRQEPRSTAQNSRYWKLLSLLSDKPVQDVKYNSDAWHEYFKFKFLGAEDIKLPNGKIITRAKSTADLDKPEFNNYMTEVEVWSNDRGVYLDE